ncbi:MAG: nicotinate (nicotinamide) nucleotide adenylyltransferase [Eubacteriales bacterium]
MSHPPQIFKTGPLRVGLFGGTFNPVHNGHLAAAESFMDELSLDILYIMPNNAPPHKDGGRSCAPAVDRLEMTRLAFSGISGRSVYVSDFEVKRGGSSYTIDTINELRSLYEGRDYTIFLLMGSDIFVTMGKWKKPDEIFQSCVVTVICRGKGEEREHMEDAASSFAEDYGARIELLQSSFLDISSTMIRERLEKGESVSHLITKNVEEYIKANGLYKS